MIGDNSKPKQTEVGIERQLWRDSFTFSQAREMCRTYHSKFTVVVLQSGGLLCTHSAIRSGWSPIWGTEICPKHINAPVICQSIPQISDCKENKQQQMWCDLTGTMSMGNTFTNVTQYSKLERPIYLKVSPECTYYCIGGPKTGSKSLTGWQLPDIAIVILEIEPLIAQIENSSNAPNVGDGKDVMTLKERLSNTYTLHISEKTLSYDYGDNVHSERWICIAIHNRMGEYAQNFKFPEKVPVTQPPYCARDIADPDNEVPPELWRKDDSKRFRTVKDPIPGQVHALATAGPGMGPSNNPNLTSSWEGASGRPTTYGGAIKHPRLDWIDYGRNHIGPRRIATNNERVKIMSAPPDTIEFYAKFDDSDEFLKRNIGNAISCMLAAAIDTSVMNHVKDWLHTRVQSIPKCIEITPDHRRMQRVIENLCNSHSDINIMKALYVRDDATELQFHKYCDLNPKFAMLNRVDTFPPIRSALVDTGANRTFLYCSVERWMHDSVPSNIRIQVADKGTSMKGSKDGKLSMIVVSGCNTKHVEDIILEPKARLEVSATTVNNLHRELISVDEHYLNGFNILMKQPDYEDGIPQMFKPATKESPEILIPFRYDYQNGGFWIDYIPEFGSKTTANVAEVINEKDSNNILLHKHLHDMNPTQTGPPAEYLSVPQAAKVAKEMSDKVEVTEVFHSRHAEEREIKGVKAGLRKRKNKMKIRDFHEEHMHMGDCPDCAICILSMGNIRRILRKVDPHKETRVCHTFHMDTITWSHRGFCGSKYEIHITDEASRWPDSLYLYSKSESLDSLEAWILQMRLDPNFKGMPYEPVQVIKMDNAGEWDLNHKEFRAMGIRHSVEFIYTSKDRKESNARAERAIGVKEPKVKACLLQSNLPPEWVIRVSRQANWLLARFPPQSHQVNCPPDGDRALPLEVITRGRVSRRMIYNQLYYYLNIGTPALVHDATIAGSRLPTQDVKAGLVADCKSRWMVAYGMYQDQVVFWDPRTNDTCRSKSYTAFKLRTGMNFAQLLGCKMPKATEKSRPLPGDFTEKVIIQLPEMRETDKLEPNPGGDPIKGIKHKTDPNSLNPIPSPTVRQYPPQENGGSVVVHDSDGHEMVTDPDTGWLLPNKRKQNDLARDLNMPMHEVQKHEMHKGVSDIFERKDVSTTVEKPIPVCEEPKIKDKVRKRTVSFNETANHLVEHDCSESYVSIEGLPQSGLDLMEAHKALPHGTTTGLTDTFVRVCKSLMLPMELHSLYKSWCIHKHRNPYGGKIISDDLPMEKNERGFVPKLAPNWFFPYPTGSKWEELISDGEQETPYENERYVEALYAEVCMDVKGYENDQPMNLSNKSASFQVAFAYTTLAQRQSNTQNKKKFPTRKKRRGPAQAADWPTTVKQALASNKPEAWKTAIATELDKLTDRGVFLHDQTASDLLAHGIITKVVPLGLYLSEKYDENGELLREKARAAIKGHSGNMQKGVHYFETYAATPQPETARLLICIALRHNWKRRAWDVELAYAWADLPVNERLALAYPKGCERTHPVTGETLYIILMKNLYGDPAAGRRWSIHRDNKLLTEFNSKNKDDTEVWTCKRCRNDPCLFYLTLRVKGHAEAYKMLISIHTDDLDVIGSDDVILDLFDTKVNEIWSLKRANPNFMLGIEKIPEYDGDGTLVSITLKMTAFVRGAVEAFKQYMPAKSATTPYPPKDTLTKDTFVTEAEIKLYSERGFSRLIGMLLWGVRHGFDECKYGMSILGSVASKPGPLAWKNAMYMLSWMDVNEKRGIRFNKDGNRQPMAFADASDKALLSDGKRQAGHAIMWMDGPIITCSHRLKHVGLCISHNEYMAICAAAKKLVWLVQLLDEIEVVIKLQIEVFGDNVQANRLCHENFVSPGNQYIAHQYHFNKEKVDEGTMILIWVDTNLNISDMYTKPTTKVTCENLMPNLLGFGEGMNVLREKILSMDPTCKPRPK